MAAKKKHPARPKASTRKAAKPALRPVPLTDFISDNRLGRLCAARIAGGLPPDPDLARRVLFLAGYLYERLVAGDDPLEG